VSLLSNLVPSVVVAVQFSADQTGLC